MLALYSYLSDRLLLIKFSVRVSFANKQHRREQQIWAVMVLVPTPIGYASALNLQALRVHCIELFGKGHPCFDPYQMDCRHFYLPKNCKSGLRL